MDIKPIETHYKGYRFRSRLEARWAVFFDALDIKWEYELEGYDLRVHGYYLPDFYLPQVNMHVEVKPTGGFTDEILLKCKYLVEQTGQGILLIEGVPGDSPVINGYELYGGMIKESQYELFNGHKYHLYESRFFSNPGWWPEYDYGPYVYTHSYNMARSARFEFGECG